MNIKRKIKVLIVDDSLIFRETLAKGIAQDLAIEVVCAGNIITDDLYFGVIINDAMAETTAATIATIINVLRRL